MSTRRTLFGDFDNRGQLSATMDKLNLKYGHTTLHFAGMLEGAGDGADTDRVHADSGAVWRGLYVALAVRTRVTSVIWIGDVRHCGFRGCGSILDLEAGSLRDISQETSRENRENGDERDDVGL